MKCVVALVLIGLLSTACQQKTKTETSEPPITVLAQPAYQLGDTLSIQLSTALSQVSVQWDNLQAIPDQPIDNSLNLSSKGKTIGLHQLIVNGTTAAKEPVHDTLTVELWSDIKPQQLTYSVLQTYPHQASSFTQGLAFYKGVLYEGTGLNGQSKLMKIDVKTGSILQSVPLPEEYFGEGITVVNDRIYQLTWTSGRCFRYTMDMTLEKTFTYHTQGWGITHRDTTLIVSDGSNRLSLYSLDFQKTGELVVYDDKGPVMNLNELEYVNGYILANVWKTNRIVLIDPVSGKVIGELNIDPTLPKGIDTKENVLNGIAYQGTENALFITGKNWPSLFRIQVNGLLQTKPAVALARR